MTKAMKWAVILGVLSALIILAAKPYKSETTPSPLRSEVQTEEVMTIAEAREAYMQGCMEDLEDDDYWYCLCTFNYLADNYSVEQIIEAGRSEDMPVMFYEAIFHCVE
jgi:hypothetical protein